LITAKTKFGNDIVYKDYIELLLDEFATFGGYQTERFSSRKK